jgi:hypothetical protein
VWRQVLKDLTDIDYVNRIAGAYGITLNVLHGDAAIMGSPERSLDRTVAEGAGQARYIVEELAPGESAKKRQIAQYQHLLKELAVPHVHPSLKNQKGSVLTERPGNDRTGTGVYENSEGQPSSAVPIAPLTPRAQYRSPSLPGEIKIEPAVPRFPTPC